MTPPDPTSLGPRQIHLSWSEVPATTLTVTWQTALADGATHAEARLATGGAWARHEGEVFKSPGAGWLRRVVLRGLQPATRYEYRVAGGSATESHWSACFEARTAPALLGAAFTAAFFCDTGLIGRTDGNASGTAQIYRELLADAPLFLLGGGDYAYANRDERFPRVADAVDEWFHQAEPLLARTPLLAQYGNHEIVLKEDYRDWAPRFAHPPGHDDQRSYSYDVAGVHFAHLFCPDRAPAGYHTHWLDQDLAAARARGCPWLVVMQHEPIFAHGTSHPAYPLVRDMIVPVLERHWVDLHLSGHDQNYERTFPLRDATSAEPRVMSPNRDYYRQGEGVVYAKVSPAGKKSEIGNRFSRLPAAAPPFIAMRDDTAHHYALLHAKAAVLVLEVFAVSGTGAPKQLLDRVTISAPQMPPTSPTSSPTPLSK